MWRDRLAASLISSKGEGLAEKTPEDRQLREDPSEADPLTELEFSERFIGELDFFAPDYARPGLAHHAWRVRTRNRSMNLTTIVEPEEMARKHAIDSLAARPLLAEGGEEIFRHVVDLGSGAGYPGLAIAIACPHLEVTLIDSTRKKVRFLEEVVVELGLSSRVHCVWGRFEDWVRDHRKNVDLVMARAVGPVEKILQWCTHSWFGPLLLWKGPAVDKELEAVRGLLWKRHLFVALDEVYQIPGDEVMRRLVLIDHRRQ